MLARLTRFFVGLLLLPLCVAASRTLFALVRDAQPASAAAVPVSTLALGGGFLLWLVVFLTLPRPVRTYVLAHELTHALWATLMGARVLRLKVTHEKGSVTLSKTNFLITLAPYFFPLYTVIAIAGYYASSIFFDVSRFQPLWLALVGVTWGFHFTFTLTTLMQHQTDIQECGRVFSYATIYLLNVLGIGLWIVTVSTPTLEQMVRSLEKHVTAAAETAWDWGRAAGRAAARTAQ